MSRSVPSLARPALVVPPIWLRLSFAALLASGCGGDRPAEDGCIGDSCRPCDDGCNAPSCEDGGCAPTAGEVATMASLLLPDGRLAIAGFEEERGDLVVIFQRPGTEERIVRLVAGAIGFLDGRWAKIALESGGGVQVAWFDPALAAVRWARGTDAGFEPAETVSPGLASHVALAIDASDRPHIAFRDDKTRTVRYATPIGGGWNLVTLQGCAGEANCPVAGSEDYGQALDLALVSGAGGVALPRIAFYDALRGDLKLAGPDDRGEWLTTTLDGRSGEVDTGDVGSFVSLAATPTRSLGVAYFDATFGGLRYLGPAGAPRVVDSGIMALADGRARRLIVGQFCTLRFDAQGNAHILYVDASTPGLRHARIPGEAGAVVTSLAIPPGMWPSFDIVGDRLIGAYGAFVSDLAPVTRLRLFDLSAVAGTP